MKTILLVLLTECNNLHSVQQAKFTTPFRALKRNGHQRIAFKMSNLNRADKGAAISILSEESSKSKSAIATP